MFWTTVTLIVLYTFLRDPRNVYWLLGLKAYILWGYARYICWAVYVMLFKDRRIVLDWDEFWHRYLYGNIRECWNRPVLSGPGIKISIAERSKSHALLPMEETGRVLECTNMGSYNYLGTGGRYFGCEDEETAERWALHARVEEFFKDLLRKDYCIVVPTGYATNSSLIPCIADLSKDPILIMSDALNHTSIVRGIQSCEKKHKVVIFKHNDVSDLELKYKEADGSKWPVVLVIVEGLYSMEGEYPPLKELVKLRDKYKNMQLYVDEAHSIGALGKTGKGICEHVGVHHSDIDFLMGTFTKSFASIGGYVTFNDERLGKEVRRLYYERFRGTITPLHTQCSSQILGVMRWLKETDYESIRKLRDNSIFLRRKLQRIGCEVLGEYDSPVIPIMLREVATIEPINRLFLNQGFAVVSVGYPATPLLEGGRLRFCVSANHEKDQLRELVQVMDKAIEDLHMLRMRVHPEQEKIDPKEPVLEPRFRDGRKFWLLEDLTGRPVPVPAELEHLELNGSRDVLQKYGCGSCGPRGFYGTTDVHLALEKSLASFYGREAAALYAHGQCVASSVIPNLVNQMGGPHKVVIETRPLDWKPRYDVMLAIKLSKAPHNPEDKKVYQTRNMLVITPDFEAKTETFKALVKEGDMSLVWVVDEFERPFGDTKKQKLPDLIMGSLEGPDVGCMGGFCVGKRSLVESQRLYAKSYVFSASPPPFLCEAARKRIKKEDE